MKHQYHSTNHADSKPRIGLIRSAVQAVVRAYERRATIRQLEAFNDHFLLTLFIWPRRRQICTRGHWS